MKEAVAKNGDETELPLLSLAGQGWRFVHFLKSKWWILLAAVGLAVVGQHAYRHFYPSPANAGAKMLVGGKVKIPEGGLYAEEWQNFFGTQMELMQGERIRRRTLDRLQRLKQNRNESPIRLEVNQTRKTTIFVLIASGKDETYTVNYLNALMDEYLSYRKEVRALSSDDTLASLTSQFLEQEKELKRHQEGMLDFQRTNSVAMLQEEASSANLTKLNQELADLKLQRALLAGTADSNSSTEAPDAAKLADAPLKVPGLSGDLRPKKALEMLKFQKQELSRILRPEHPKMQKLDKDIASAEKLVSLYKNDDQDQISEIRDSLDLKIKGVEAAIREWETKMVDANARLAQYTLLKENLDRVQNLYDHLLHLLQNVGLDKNVDQETVVIMDPAAPVVLEKGFKRDILAGIVGLIVGLGIVGFLANHDDRLTSVKELKLHFPERLVGQIPDVSSRRRNGFLELLAPQDRRHTFAESYRAIRSSLLFMEDAQSRPRTILVTSAMPGEGKSTVAANLARSLAFAGSRVLLVDGDLRTGKLHDALGLPSEPGLNQLGCFKEKLKDLPMATSLANLYFIPRGESSGACGELFLNPAIDTLLEELSATFDYLVIDSAPVFAAADTLSLAPKVGGVIFVMRDSFTRADLAREALSQLNQIGVRVLGIIFNRANGSKGHYQYFTDSEYQQPAGRG